MVSLCTPQSYICNARLINGQAPLHCRLRFHAYHLSLRGVCRAIHDLPGGRPIQVKALCLGSYELSRSYEPLTEADLKRLGKIAANDREDLFKRNPETGRLYSDRLFAVALCQGGALHYLNGQNGIKDLDVWSFFKPNPKRQFPYRRRAQLDFGDPKFGQTADAPEFVGRRVDHIGRAIPARDYTDPVVALRQYLRSGATESARRLAEKAVVLIEPAHLFGTVVWPESHLNISIKPKPIRGSA